MAIEGGPPSGGAGGEPSGRRLLIGELLVQAKVLTMDQLELVLSGPREPGKKIGQLLIERGLITEAQLTQTLSLQLSVPWVSLYHIDFSRQLLNRVQRDVAERYCLIPIFVRHVKGQGETLYVAMDDPTNEAALAEVSRQASLPAKPMIASASDIRSAIRVYYGEPSSEQVADVPNPPLRAEPATTREGARVEPADKPRPPPPPPVPSRRSAEVEPPPPTTRSSPPSVVTNPAADAPEPAAPGTASSPPPPQPATSAAGDERPRRRAKVVSLTLLDGTTLKLPTGKKDAAGEGLTARDFVSALRATAHGADATEILGEAPRWEPVVAALLSILLRKGLIADWEFVEELRKS